MFYAFMTKVVDDTLNQYSPKELRSKLGKVLDVTSSEHLDDFQKMVEMVHETNANMEEAGKPIGEDPKKMTQCLDEGLKTLTNLKGDAGLDIKELDDTTVKSHLIDILRMKEVMSFLLS